MGDGSGRVRMELVGEGFKNWLVRCFGASFVNYVNY
jgi:hypothetical protein